jgi:hypothetical protein
MGRKGVSKRKPQQTKSKPFSADKASGSVASAMQAVEPTRSTESGKISSTGDRKNQRKG